MRRPFNPLVGSAVILLLTNRMTHEQLESIVPNIQAVLTRGVTLLKDLLVMLEYIETKAAQVNDVPALHILEHFRKAEFVAATFLNLNNNK
jgi:hypothetical protein